MKIFICGWYGTETLGDRAILAGILKILDKSFGEAEVVIGSLYPFFTKRTLIEDNEIYSSIASKIKIDYFNVKDVNQLNQNINLSDLVIFGGGPIMDLTELEIMRYIFVKAKNKNKKTAILGCGIGPLYKKQFKKIVSDIFKHSDLIIFRDSMSVKSAIEICNMESGKYNFSHDPAILAVGEYKRKHIENKQKNSIAINMREFHNIGYGGKECLDNNKLLKLLDIISNSFDKIDLIPMHTYGVGGDDRLYLTNMYSKLRKNNIEVIHKPQNLFQLFDIYANSTACVGMRYHSVVFQTLLNGNNFVLDYTNINNGKINSFLKLVDEDGFYNERYINIQQDIEMTILENIPDKLLEKDIFKYDNNIFKDTLNYYSDKIKEFI